MPAVLASDDASLMERGKALKVALASEINRRGLLETALVREHTTAHICSNTDFVLPLLLGARRIDLIDPILNDPAKLTLIEEQLRNVAGEVERIDNQFSAHIDFGQGKELVHITCLAQRLISPHDIEPTNPAALKPDQLEEAFGWSKPSTEVYTPSGPLGLILGYNSYSVRVSDNPQLTNNLVPGGYILNLETLDGLPDWEAILNTMPESEEFLDHWLVQQYEKDGNYRYIPLETDFNEPMSFLQKIRP